MNKLQKLEDALIEQMLTAADLADRGDRGDHGDWGDRILLNLVNRMNWEI